MKTKVYADHAATTKLDENAFEAMKPFLLDEYGNASQLYSFARGPREALKEARRAIADCIGASPEEIYFTSGGTESDNWAIKGAMAAQDAVAAQDEVADSVARRVITSAIEHHAVLHSCAAIERLGCPVTYLQPDGRGVVTGEVLRKSMDDSTRLVSIMHANNEIGAIQPIRELADIAHRHGALFHTDAVQAVGHIPIDVKELGVDMLSASAHKFNGPKGVGFLYVKNDAKVRNGILPYQDGGAQEAGFRAGTENVAGIVGMSVALRQSCASLEERMSHLRELEEAFLGRLRQSGLDFRRNGDGAAYGLMPGNVSVSFRNADGEALLHRLDLMGICVSTGSACNSKSTELSHVLRAIQVPPEYAYGTIRVSFGYENTPEEAAYVADCIEKVFS